MDGGLKGKRLLVLGGTPACCAIVRKAKQMGLYVMATDYLSNSPAKKIADASFMVSVKDVDSLAELCRDNKADGVITGYIEFMLPYYSELCDRLSLPCYVTKEQIALVCSKKSFKALCRNHGIKVAEDYHIGEGFNRADLDRVKYPVIIKPVDNGGSRGISVCGDEAELKTAYCKAMAFSKSGEAVVERFIDGGEVAVFYFIREGEAYLYAMTDRSVIKTGDGLPPLPSSYLFPSKHLSKYMEDTDCRAKKMFKSIGMKNGVIFIQALVENGEFIFHDIALRLTPVFECYVTEKLSGINTLEMLIRYAVTGRMHDGDIAARVNPDLGGYGCNVTFSAMPGRIAKIYGAEQAAALPGVIAAVPSYSEGDLIPDDALGTLKQVVLRFYASAESERETEELITKIRSLVDIRSEDGLSMLVQ